MEQENDMMTRKRKPTPEDVLRRGRILLQELEAHGDELRKLRADVKAREEALLQEIRSPESR